MGFLHPDVVTTHLIAPAGLADAAHPSGGNAYDRAVVDGLRERGRAVVVTEVEGAWPDPARADVEALVGVLAGVEDGAVVLVDGLVGLAAGPVLAGQADRLRLVLLVHLPLGGEHATSQRAALRAARAVVVPSRWAGERLRAECPELHPERVHVVPPGVDPAPPSVYSDVGGRLLSVGALTRIKGQDVVADALATLADLSWTWRCVGALDLDGPHVRTVVATLDRSGLRDRLDLTGPLSGGALDEAYADADLLVLGSRVEAFGMVATEALARGLPVVAPDVGGLREAVDGSTAERPGVLVASEDPAALAQALRGWLTDRALRGRLRDAAAGRRSTLTGWPVTLDGIEAALDAAAID